MRRVSAFPPPQSLLLTLAQRGEAEELLELVTDNPESAAAELVYLRDIVWIAARVTNKMPTRSFASQDDAFFTRMEQLRLMVVEYVNALEQES